MLARVSPSATPAIDRSRTIERVIVTAPAVSVAAQASATAAIGRIRGRRTAAYGATDISRLVLQKKDGRFLVRLSSPTGGQAKLLSVGVSRGDTRCLPTPT